MTFTSVGQLADAQAERSKYLSFRKLPAVVTGAGTWYDYSMAPGNPTPQYYAAAPLTAQTMARSTDGGIQHGGNVSPRTKYLRRLTAMAVAAAGAARVVHVRVVETPRNTFDYGEPT